MPAYYCSALGPPPWNKAAELPLTEPLRIAPSVPRDLPKQDGPCGIPGCYVCEGKVK